MGVNSLPKTITRQHINSFIFIQYNIIQYEKYYIIYSTKLVNLDKTVKVKLVSLTVSLILCASL